MHGISSGIAVTPEEASLVRSNKDSIKKMVLSELASHGIGKDHPDFKEVYQMTARGVTFALRHVLEIRKVGRTEVKPLVRTHLDMIRSPGALVQVSLVFIRESFRGRATLIVPISAVPFMNALALFNTLSHFDS
ncbi:hypothetical protein BS47DRAFT_767659 [Hydnum rufescens UP504]|uniref:Sld7 C-terminal domain-containing protein n=1 Tax=Hydnum rufescens UP504 TaxID=1448309 RepID=A0A9P6DVQ4_9AGAM|nr:hypothetical protein BS47DRAFT_767659 [Hydnum rufescens UP504]